jgi:hypothetical protein
MSAMREVPSHCQLCPLGSVNMSAINGIPPAWQLLMVFHQHDSFFFNYLLALIGGPTFLRIFFIKKLRHYKKKIVSSDENKKLSCRT